MSGYCETSCDEIRDSSLSNGLPTCYDLILPKGKVFNDQNGIMLRTTIWVRYKARGGRTLYGTNDDDDSLVSTTRRKWRSVRVVELFLWIGQWIIRWLIMWVNPLWSVAGVLDCLFIDIWFFICWVEVVPFFDIIYWVKLLELSHSFCSWTLKFWACGNCFLG